MIILDIAIVEVGLGGRLDATNIVTPIASVITPIAEDHQQWLGDTLDQIATEKAGIINEYRKREFYEKPTQEKKRKKAAAVKREKKRVSREHNRSRRLY